MISSAGKTIAVIGATGRQGREVVRHLLEHGWQVRALTRKPQGQKAEPLRALGAWVVEADMDDRRSLDAACANAYGVYSMGVPVPGKMEVEIRQGKNTAEAAKAAGVKHVVYGSAGPGEEQTGIEQWDAKIEITRAMKELGLPLTVLRPMAFMELMTDPTYYPNSSTWNIWPRLTGWDRPIVWLSVQDLGAIAARVFADPGRFLGRDLKLASDVQTLEECRAIYREVMGKAPSRFPMPMFLFEAFVGKDIPRMWRWLRSNRVSLDTAPTLEILPGALTVRTWLERMRG